MAARQVIVPGAMPSRDANGRSLPAKFRFYEVDTALTTPKTVYTASDLVTPHAFPLLSDSAGRWPQIWADEDDYFDVGWTDQLFDQTIATFRNVRPVDGAVLASVALAEAAAEEAKAAAYAAAGSAANLDTIATSSSTHTTGGVGTLKAFALDQTNKDYAQGQVVVAAKVGSLGDAFLARVETFADPVLSLRVTGVSGAGGVSGSSWIISQIPPDGVQSIAGLFGPAITAADLKAALGFDYNDIYDALGYAPAGSIDASVITIKLSNTPSFETTRITFSAGQCRDSTNAVDIVLSSGLSKRLDAAWAAGTGNGGRDAGSLSNGQTWHCFVIVDVDTGTEDALFSLSPTSPTLPTGYDHFRRVGSIVLDAAATTIKLFDQTGNWFTYKTRSADFAATANGAGPYLRTCPGLPNGIRVRGQFYLQSAGDANATTFLSLVWDPAFGAPPAFGGSTQWAQVTRFGVRNHDNSGAVSSAKTVCTCFTNTSQQVYTYASDANDALALGVLGWEDTRSL